MVEREWHLLASVVFLLVFNLFFVFIAIGEGVSNMHQSFVFIELWPRIIFCAQMEFEAMDALALFLWRNKIQADEWSRQTSRIMVDMFAFVVSDGR